MSLYDRCGVLALRLEAAKSADASSELLNRGGTLADHIEDTARYLAAAAALRAALETPSRPKLDIKVVAQKVGAFRRVLTNQNAGAFQQQSAAALEEVAINQRKVTSRWVSTMWGSLFDDYAALIERAQKPMVGNPTQRTRAKSRAQTLTAVSKLDPIDEVDQLEQRLGGRDVASWIAAIHRTAAELQAALEALDAEHDSFAADVRDVLEKAASPDGLLLSDVTDELLAALRGAGLDDQLVVRRQ